MKWIEAQWNENNQCDSAPNLILSFSTPDYYSDQKSFKNYNKSFPLNFRNNDGYAYPILPCGLSAISLPDRKFCCTSWLYADEEISQVKSGANILIQNDTDASKVFKSSPGTSYCQLYPQTGSIFQYSSIMIKNDGSCNPIQIFNGSKASTTYISCSEKNVFSVYDTSYCGTPKKFYQLPTIIANISPDNSINASISKLSGGDMTVGWITYSPEDLLVPIYDNAPEVCALVLGVFAVLIFIFCSIVAGFKWKNRGQSEDRLLAINYGLLAINCTMGFIVYNISINYAMCKTSKLTKNNENTTICKYNNNLILYNSKFAINIFEYVTQLILVFHSGMILFRILNTSQTIKITAGVIIITLSLITKGGTLAKYLLLIIGEYYNFESNSKEYLSYYFLATSTDSWINRWSQISSFWTLFMFCWNIVPMNVALFQIANRKKRNSTFRQAFENVMKLDVKGILSIINMMHLFVLTTYYILSYFLYNTSIFGNDRTQMAIDSLKTNCVAYHCILNYFFNDRVKAILLSTINTIPLSTVTSNKEKIEPPPMKKLRDLINQNEKLSKVDQNAPTVRLNNNIRR